MDLTNTSLQWPPNNCLRKTWGVDTQGRLYETLYNELCHTPQQVSPGHHDQSVVVFVEERKWCIKETVTDTPTKDVDISKIGRASTLKFDPFTEGKSGIVVIAAIAAGTHTALLGTATTNHGAFIGIRNCKAYDTAVSGTKTHQTHTKFVKDLKSCNRFIRLTTAPITKVVDVFIHP